MGKMKSMELAYDYLLEMGLEPNCWEFENILMGAMACTYDPFFARRNRSDVLEAIAEMDAERGEDQVAEDLHEYFRRCGVASIGEVILAGVLEAAREGVRG